MTNMPTDFVRNTVLNQQLAAVLTGWSFNIVYDRQI